MTRPDAVLRDTSHTGGARGYYHRHPQADESGSVVWAEAWFADPADAVKASLACGPTGCSPECTRARDKGHRGYVVGATT